MLINISEFVKGGFFNQLEGNFCVLSDVKINCNNFFKLETTEPVGTILHYSNKFDFVFVILDTINFDNIARLYKYNLKNVCILNLNSGYSGIGKKLIVPDLDDIYIKHNIEILEPMDFENFRIYVDDFLETPCFTHIRIPDKEFDEKIINDDFDLDYRKIINFNQFNFSGFTATIIAYGSLLPETISALNMLKEIGYSCDFFRTGNYKSDFNNDLIQSLSSHDQIFVIGDFDYKVFQDYIFSKFFDTEIEKKQISFITPFLTNPVIKEYLSDKVKMSNVDIFERIKSEIDDLQ